jgi:hypothetical protein
MKFTLLRVATVGLIAVVVSPAFASNYTTIGNFAGGVAETGWGRFSGGVQPLNANVYTVTDLDTSGDGGALETNLAGFSDSFGYSFSTAGTSADWFDSGFLVMDLIYRGTATNINDGGFSQVFQVLFQSDFNSFELQAYTTNSDGVPLNQFGGGGTAVGWAANSEFVQTLTSVVIDYRSFRDYLIENGHTSPSTLQFWMSTNDSNRVFKAIDNVRLLVPEPASIVLMGLALLGLVGMTRRR